MKRLRVGTRSSALARWQTSFVTNALAALDSTRPEVVEVSTAGDEFPEALIADLEGTGLFTSALERALLAGEIDVAVHSFKDLPVDPHPQLRIAAVPERGPVEDVLCALEGHSVATLPPGARVGTSSARRAAQLRRMRRDLELMPLRGNVPTRIERVRRGDLDAIVLARAGLERLGLMAHATQVFTVSEVLPAPAQGALAVQIRAADSELGARLGALDHAPSRHAAECERAVLHLLAGGCAVPVGASATCAGGEIRLIAGVFDPDSDHSARIECQGREAVEVARRAAVALDQGGAREILERFARSIRVGPEVS
jgi:hydroxymethylbilane synthase